MITQLQINLIERLIEILSEYLLVLYARRGRQIQARGTRLQKEAYK